MKKFFFKIIMANVMIANFFYISNISYAYDLPKIKVEETNAKINRPIKKDALLTDKNYVFISEYKGLKFYLDRYSIKVKKNKTGNRSWSQFIFPIGANVTSQNSVSTLQKFYFDGIHTYNSTRKKNKIDDINDQTDKDFLLKCFKIGYHFAFEQNN